MDQERLARTQSALQSAGLDGLVCRLPENIVLLTGYWPFIGRSAVIVPASGEPILIAPGFETESLKRAYVADVRTFRAWQLSDPAPDDQLGRLLSDALSDRGLTGASQRIGCDVAESSSIEDVGTTQKVLEPWAPSRPARALLQQAAPKAQIVDATLLISQLRATKTPLELERIRVANEIAGFGIEAFFAGVRAGRSEVEVASEVEAAILRRGTGYKGTLHARGQAMVIAGRDRLSQVGWAVARSSERLIGDGDVVLLELSVVADGYYADLTRMRCAGQPPEAVIRGYRSLQRALEAAVHAVRAGGRACDVDAAARAVLREQGLDGLFVHHSGHGVGFRYHEPVPFLHPSSTDTLQAGMVTTVEPGLYGGEIGGLRLEQNVAVTEQGAEVLSTASLSLEG